MPCYGSRCTWGVRPSAEDWARFDVARENALDPSRSARVIGYVTRELAVTASPHSAFHCLAFLADRSPLPGLMDILQRVRYFAGRVAHVDRNLADLFGCVHSEVAKSLNI